MLELISMLQSCNKTQVKRYITACFLTVSLLDAQSSMYCTWERRSNA